MWRVKTGEVLKYGEKHFVPLRCVAFFVVFAVCDANSEHWK